MVKSPIVGRETLLTCSRFNVERVTQQLPNGTQHTREIIKHPGAVVILPILDSGEICLIRNFRVAVEQWLLELPAGTLDRDEPPIETARRELIEETGFNCKKLEPLCEFYMSPGILDERMHAFVARGLTAGQQHLETGELIETEVVAPSTIEDLIRQGKILDSKSISALLFHLHFST